jgi:hypothetical protein
MTSRTTQILLTLDCGAVDQDALRALKLLTDDQDIEVTGLYVEDEDLLRAALLPGMAEVSPAGTVSRLDQQALVAQIAQQARRAREGFEASARREKLKFTFKVARGRVVETLVAAAARSDLVVINRSRRSSGLRTRHGTHFAPLLAHHNNLLFVNEPWLSGRAVVLLCENPGGCVRALETAQRIAQAEGLELLIAVPREHADFEMAGSGRAVVLAEWTEAAIVALCESADARLLVVPPVDGLDWRTLLVNLVDRLSCSLLRLE